MKPFKIEVSKGRFKIHAFLQRLGADILVSIWGGNRPHIGAVGMATPRPSLRDPKQWSATSSNFTFVGHKEDAVVKRVSEMLASQLRTHVVVTAGIHWNAISVREIETIEKLTDELADLILERLKR